MDDLRMITGELSGSYVADIDYVFEQFSLSLRKHSRRVAICCLLIAGSAMKEVMSFRNYPHEVSLDIVAHLTGTLHDIGKTNFINEDSSGNSYRQHPENGAEFLQRYKSRLFSDDIQAKYVIDAVRFHHEQPDGKGFPHQLKGNDIPLAASICAVADKIDHVAYNDKDIYTGGAYILKKIKREDGTVLQSSVVACMEKAWSQIVRHYIVWNSHQEQGRKV